MVAIVAGNGLGLQSSSALGLGDRGRIGNASFGQTGEQIYVNAATGNLVIQDRDELLLGQGVNSQIYRAYNSQGKMVGDNWRPGGMKTVDGLTGMVNTAGSTVTRTDWDGSAITYFYDSGSNTYGPITGLGARDALSFDAASSTWNWVDGSHRLSEAYDANHGGRLVTSRDRDGNTVSYTYNANGLLSQVRTASGDVTWLDYNGAQQLAALRTVYQSASGQQITATTVRYAYDSQGRLSEVVVDLTPEDNSVADSKVFKTTYTYDGVSSRIVSITQSDGSSVAFSYKLVEGDYRVSCIAQTSDVGTVRRTYLDYQPAAKTTTITDPLGLVTVLRYDRNNRLTSIMSPAAGGASREQNFAYDPYGRVSLVEDNELSIQYRYDSQGNLDWQRDRAGNRVERTYGADNQLLTETVINLQGTSSTTRYVYDTQNHVRFMVSAVGRVTEYRYNALGQQTSVLSYSGALYTATSASETELSNWVAALADRSQGTRVDTDYDFRGNVVNVTQYGKLLADGSGDANAGAGEMTRVRYVYDPFGRLLQRIAGDAGHPQIEQFAYDGLGRLVSATKFDGTVTLYQYDDTRHQTVVTFSNGLSRTSTYDAAGELVSVTESSPGKVLSQIHNQYDGDGHLRMSSDATGRVTHYLYDEIGRAVARIDPEGAMVEYTYTPGGLLVSTTQYATPVSAAALGSLVDGGGRPVEMVIVGGKSVALTLANANVRPVASQADRTDWRGYDDAGRLTATANANGSVVRYQYDGAGRLTARTECAGTVDVTKGNPAQSYIPPDSVNDRITRYFYDLDGLVLGQLDAEGYLTTYRYNAAGQKVETVVYATATPVSSRAVSNLADLIPPAGAKDVHQYFLYDARGLLRSEIDGEGYLVSYQYDAYGNVSQRLRGKQVSPAWLGAPQQVPVTFQAKTSTAGGVGATLEVWIDGVKAGAVTIGSTGYASYALTASNIVPVTNHTIEFRSAAGAQIAVKDASFGMRPFAGAADAGRTAPVAGNPAQVGVSYTLDAAQTALCWASLPGALEQTGYVYDAMGRLTERTAWSSSGNATTRFTYDDQGRITSEAIGDRTVSYRYDVQGRLTGQLSGEGSAALAALGKSPSAAQVDGVWKSWGVQYAYDAAGRRASMTDANGNRTLYYYDNAGRLTHVVNPLGEVVESLYDAFGEVTQTVAYATRVASAPLTTLEGGLLTDTLKSAFSALGNDGLATRTSFSYGATGALTQLTDALGLKTRYTYNAFGEQISVTRDISASAQVQNTTDYDRLGRAIRQASDAGGLNLIARAVYDAFGRVTESVDANGVLRRQDYDRNGQVAVFTDGTGAQSRMTYDAFGNVLKRTDATGNTTTYGYTAFNREITVTTAEGIRTTSSYNESGQLITLTDGRGNAIRYAYDRDGNLVGTTDATGATVTRSYDHADRLIDTVDARGTHTAYAYDAAGRVLTRTVDPAGLKLVTRYEYDAKGQATKVTDPSGVVTETQYDLNGQQVSITIDKTGLNLRTTFAYDGMGNVLTVTEGAGSGNPRVTQNTYDKTGRLVSTTVDPAGLRLTTQYTYDGTGNVIVSTDPAGAVTRYAYDSEGREIWRVDAVGALRRTVYDAAGRVASRTAYIQTVQLSAGAQDAATIAAAAKARAGQDEVTTYVYDADGNVRYVVDALRQVVEQVRDASGNVVRTVAYASALGGSVALTVTGIAGALAAQGTAAHAADRSTRNVYDAANRLSATIDALGYVTQLRYDAGGALVGHTQFATRYTDAGNPGDAQMQAWLASAGVAQPAQDRATTWIRDAAARTVYEVDAESYVTETRYDGAGRVTMTVRYALRYDKARTANRQQISTILPATLPTSAAVTRFEYDKAGRLVTLTSAAGVATRFTLDDAGHAIMTRVGDEKAIFTERVYDAAGRVLEEVTTGSTFAAETRYQYDGAGRVLTRTDPRGAELTEHDTQWALQQRKASGIVDASGQPLSASQLNPQQRAMLLARYTTCFEYNARGDLVRTTDPLGWASTNEVDAFGNVTQSTDANGYVTQYGFDALNRVVSVQLQGLARTQSTYDAFGSVVQVTQGASVTKLEYDTLGRLTKSNDAMQYAERYSYDGFGNRTGYTNRIGGQFTYEYDRLGNIVAETLPVTSSGKPVVNRSEYDARGNRITLTEAAALQEQRVTRYEYDLADRLVATRGAAVTTISRYGTTSNISMPPETREYDESGNLTRLVEVNGAVTRFYYDDSNRRIAQVGPTGTYTRWDYDAAGNVVCERIYAQPVTATAGQRPPVTPTDTTGMRETRYVYDAMNRLRESTVTGVYYGDALMKHDPSQESHDLQPGADGQYEWSFGNITRKWDYDGNGNVIVATDPRGYRTTTFWSAQGKVLEIDALNYGTAWKRDAQGNVISEVHFARKFTNPYTVHSDAQYLIDHWPISADDRTTVYTWDLNGRMSSQARQGVVYASVDANGNLSMLSGEAKSTYGYDGEGHLTRRTDANGASYDYGYDAVGRKISEMLPSFLDYRGRSVRAATVYEYDGLNHVTREIASGNAGDADRVTTYVYGAGGRLMSKVNALGVETQFGYDVAGNTTIIRSTRADTSGRKLLDVTELGYDLANREVSRKTDSVDAINQYQTVYSGTRIELRYNAFGEVTGRRTNGGTFDRGQLAQYQEFAVYDNAGRLTSTNFDDGVTHFYLYDESGNATLKIESMTRDLRDMTVEQVMNSKETNQTFTRYDGRNQVLRVEQPAVSAAVPHVTFRNIDLDVDRYANTQLTVGGWLTEAELPVVGPKLSVVDGVGGATEYRNPGLEVSSNLRFGMETRKNDKVHLNGFDVDLPDMSALYGSDYRVRVVFSIESQWMSETGEGPYGTWSNNPFSTFTRQMTYTGAPTGKRSVELSADDGTDASDLPNEAKCVWSGVSPGQQYLTYNVKFYVNDDISPVMATSATVWRTEVLNDVRNYIAVAGRVTKSVPPSETHIVALTSTRLPADAQATLYYRKQGSNDGYQSLTSARSSLGDARKFMLNTSSLADGAYELILVVSANTTDNTGELLARQQYTLNVANRGEYVVVTPQNASAPDAPISTPSYLVNSTGTFVWRDDGTLNVIAPLDLSRHAAPVVKMQYRLKGSTVWSTEETATSVANSSQFSLDSLKGKVGNYEIKLNYYTAGGATLMSSAKGAVSFDGLGGGKVRATAFELHALGTLNTSVTFESQPEDAAYIVVDYGQGELNWHTTTVYRQADGSFVWDTSADGLAPALNGRNVWDLEFVVYDDTGMALTQSRGRVTLGDVTGEDSHSGKRVELKGSSVVTAVPFDPVAAGMPKDLAWLDVYWRPVPRDDVKTNPSYTLTTIKADHKGRFRASIGLEPNTEYQYYYIGRGSDGTVYPEVRGLFETGSQTNDGVSISIVGVLPESRDQRDLKVVRSQTYNAFGEISSETSGNAALGDPEPYTTHLEYNTAGYLVLKTEPKVWVTLANGYRMEMSPQTQFWYDRMGNLVGRRDANGHLSTQQWVNTGQRSQVSKSWDALHESRTYTYDTFGNLRIGTDEMGRRTDYTYDAGDRLTRVERPVLADGTTRSLDTYTYDSVGNRLTHTNALGRTEMTWYDVQGRVVKTVSALGSTVTYDYAWSNALYSVGGSNGICSGGWTKTTIDANGVKIGENYDLYGRQLWHMAFSGSDYLTSEYNWAGLLTRQKTVEGDKRYSYYSNGLVYQISDLVLQVQTQYEYDRDGHRTVEYRRSLKTDTIQVSSQAVYDALGRIVELSDVGYTIQYEYDAVGNRRRMWTQYNHVIERTRVTADYWYEYDADDRFTVSMGQLSGGARATSASDTSIHVIAGSSGDGVQLAYNAAGERVLARYAEDGRTEAYAYDANGALTDERINGVLVRQRTNDALGQVTRYAEWNAAGTQKTQDVKRTWDADGQLQREDDGLDGSTTMYTRMRDGTLTKVVRSNLENPSPTTTLTTTYEYEWHNVPKLKRVTSQASNPQAPGWKPSVSTYTYDVNGNLKSVYDDGGGDARQQRAVLYRTDDQGRVLRRDEMIGATLGSSGNIIGGIASHEHAYHYFDGQRVADFGDDGAEKVDYAQQLSGQVDRGEQRYKYSNPVLSADVGGSYEGVSGTYPLMSPGKWTVSAGQTLQSVAQALWGDAGLWYVLAEANGLKGEDVLKTGQVLTVPNRITNVHNTSQTFRAYDPGRAIGNTQPTLPEAPPVAGSGGGHGCGGVGDIVAVVVAVVASVVSVGALAPVMGAIAAGAVGGAMGAAMASQNPDGPQLKDVALGAAGGAVAGGFGASGLGNSLAGAMSGLGETGSQIAAQAVMGAGRSAVTQGIAVATGLAGGFDWKGVAASAIASGAGYGVGRTSIGRVPVVGSIASGMAAGAASTLARGGSLTKNLTSISADAIASTVGNLVLGQVAQASAGKPATAGNGSMSTLYGAGDSYEELVRQTAQSSYSVNAGDQFAWLASGNLNRGSTFDVTAASLELTTEVAYSRIAADNGRSIVGPSISPDVIGNAVPYPQISVRPLLDGNAGTIRNLNGLESFMAFNPLGQVLGGAADHVSAMVSGFWNVVTHPVDTAEAIGARYGNAYAAGRLGDTVLGDAGGVLTGAVRSSPLGLVDAMYHQDQAGAAYRMGGAVLDAALFAGPSLAGPALEAGAAMFGPKIAGVVEIYGARTGLIFQMAESGPVFSSAPTINGSANAIRETVLANITESQAARASSQFDRLARYDTAYSFYSDAGFSADRILGHLQGIDFAQPASVVQLGRGSNYVQYVANGRVGNYFAPIDTPATMLGINPAGRTAIMFTPTQPVMALQSTAARIVDTWTVPGIPFNATGGGTQFFVPNKQFMRQVP